MVANLSPIHSFSRVPVPLSFAWRSSALCFWETRLANFIVAMLTGFWFTYVCYSYRNEYSAGDREFPGSGLSIGDGAPFPKIRDVGSRVVLARGQFLERDRSLYRRSGLCGDERRSHPCRISSSFFNNLHPFPSGVVVVGAAWSGSNRYFRMRGNVVLTTPTMETFTSRLDTRRPSVSLSWGSCTSSCIPMRSVMVGRSKRCSCCSCLSHGPSRSTPPFGRSGVSSTSCWLPCLSYM